MKYLKNIKLPIKLFISLGILAVLMLRMDMATLEEMATHVKASAWVYATALVLIQLFVLSLRWMFLINIGRHRMTYSDSLQVTLASLLANMLFITSIGGIFVRIALALQHGASLFKSIFATGIDRLMTLAALVLLSAIFLPALGQYLESDVYQTLAIFMGVFIFTLFVFTPIFFTVILRKIPRLPFAAKSNITSGIRYLKLLFSNQALIAKIMLASLIAQLSFFASIYCLSVSADVSLTFLEMMTVLPIISLVAALPISIGGWGVRESAFIYGLGLLGVPMETAFLISVQVGLISMVATIIAGIPAIMASDVPLLSPRSKMLAHKVFRAHK